MSRYGDRDGVFHAKKLAVDDKIAVSYTIPYLIAVSTTALLNGSDFSTATVKLARLFTVQPPYPMRISINAVSAGTTGSTPDKLTFTGFDAKGNFIVEDVNVSSTAGTAAAARTYTTRAFARLTQVESQSDITSTDVNIGIASGVGLPYPIASSADVLTIRHGLNYGTSERTAHDYNFTHDVVSLPTMTAGSTFHIVYSSKLQR